MLLNARKLMFSLKLKVASPAVFADSGAGSSVIVLGGKKLHLSVEATEPHRKNNAQVVI